MAQITIDTNTDTVEEMEHAVLLLQKAITRRNGAVIVTDSPQHAARKLDMPQTAQPDEETALDTPFLKITVKSDDAPKNNVPTLNQLLNDEKLTEDELKKLYKEVIPQAEDEDSREHSVQDQKDKKDDAFIEIIEYEDAK